MKPTKSQYFFAHNISFKVWQSVGTPVCVAIIIWATEPTFALLYEPWEILWHVLTILLSLPIGWFCSLIAGSVFLGTINEYRGLKNGGPFQVGDQVLILTGPHRDRICRVYSLCQGGSVRVEIGEIKDEKIEDIFPPYQVFKVESTEVINEGNDDAQH